MSENKSWIHFCGYRYIMEAQSIKISPLLLLMEEKYGYLYDEEDGFTHRITGESVTILWNENGTIAKGFAVHPEAEVYFPSPVNNQRAFWVKRRIAS